MSASVNIKEFKEALKFMVSVSKESEIRTPVLLHGMHALGKTEVVKQVAEEMGYRCETLNLSTQDVSDLLGLPFKDEQFFNGKEEVTENAFLEVCKMSEKDLGSFFKQVTTRFAMPDWLSDALRDERDCIFFLDEMNRAALYVLQTMLPFVLEGRLHTHKLRSGDFVIGAMNPDTADYNVETVTDKALLSRFAHFYFEPEVSEWISYMKTKGGHSAVIDAVIADDTVFGDEHVKDSDKIKARPDRRNADKASMLLNHIKKEHVDNGMLYTVMSAMLGEDLSAVIRQNYVTKKKLSIDDIFTGEIFKEDINYSEDLDRIRPINEMLKTALAGGEGKIWEMNNDSPSEWSSVKSQYVKYIIDKESQKNLLKWFNTCPKDSLLGVIKDLRNELVERYKETTTKKKKSITGAYILMSLLSQLDQGLVDYVWPSDD